MPVNPALMKKLLKLDGAVTRDYDPFAHVIEPSSPSLAYTFDQTWGLPLGYSLLLWGECKGGKSLVARMLAGDLHRQDPDAVVLNFNTELREELQASAHQLNIFGVDPNRYQAFNTNRPSEIFDVIEQDIPKLIDEGLKIKLIIIDSLTDIIGRKMSNADSVDDFLIGDVAATIGDGLNRIKATLRKYRIATILVAQARAEMDPLEQKRGKKIKMAAAWAVRHKSEFFMKVEHLKTLEGKTDLMGNSFQDKTIENVMSGAKDSEYDIVGRKIKCTMEQSSCGRDGRTGIFTLHKDKGLINVNEEVFLLGEGNFHVIEHPNNVTYQFKGRQWHGKEAMLLALKEDSQLRKDVLAACKRRDLERREIAPTNESAEDKVIENLVKQEASNP